MPTSLLAELLRAAPPSSGEAHFRSGMASRRAATYPGRVHALFTTSLVRAGPDATSFLCSGRAGRPVHVAQGLNFLVSGGRQSAFNGISHDQEVEEAASEAKATAALSDMELRKVIERANDAAEDALSAAKVAVWTEVITAFGTVAGLISTWIAWKMDDSQLPPEMQVPDIGSSIPNELKRPPPGPSRPAYPSPGAASGSAPLAPGMGPTASGAASPASSAGGRAAATSGLPGATSSRPPVTPVPFPAEGGSSGSGGGGSVPAHTRPEQAAERMPPMPSPSTPPPSSTSIRAVPDPAPAVGSTGPVAGAALGGIAGTTPASAAGQADAGAVGPRGQPPVFGGMPGRPPAAGDDAAGGPSQT